MRKLKVWLRERYLPAYCREAMLEENRALAAQVEAYRAENARLLAYIDGMETALRRQPRIIINAKEVSRP